jgi:hypothetical protein
MSTITLAPPVTKLPGEYVSDVLTSLIAKVNRNPRGVLPTSRVSARNFEIGASTMVAIHYLFSHGAQRTAWSRRTAKTAGLVVGC